MESLDQSKNWTEFNPKESWPVIYLLGCSKNAKVLSSRHLGHLQILKKINELSQRIMIFSKFLLK